MIGVERQPGMWVASLVGSVAVHVGVGALLVMPWAGMLQTDIPPPAIDLSLSVVPETITEPDAPEVEVEDPEAPPAEPLDTPAPDEIGAVDEPVDAVPAAEPEEIAAAEPEELAPVEPEPPAAPEPPPEPVPPTAPAPPAPPVPAAPVAPVTPPAAPAATAAVVAASPVPASILRPEEGAPGGGGAAPVAAAPLSPVTAVTNPAVISTAMPAAPVVIGAVPAFEPPPPPAQPASSPAPGGGGPETPAGELVRRIRGELAVPCLVALPRQAADGTLSLDYISANEADIIAFADRLMAGAAERPAERRILIDPRQCPALNYVRSATRYPGSPIGLGLVSATVPNEGNLQGALRNAGGRYVSLLVIDVDGVVQDIGPFMTFAGSTVQFDAPVTRNGAARDTAQLVLAIATDTRPPALDSHIGRLAEEFFPALSATAGPSTLMALESFVVP